jgi:tetratricopeptide (TPR) repeat protein
MGVVYSAYDPTLDRRVALKFLRPESRAPDIAEQRLLREAQAMARLSHPNVAVAYEVGLFSGHVYIAMEFVDGVDLRRWLADAPRPPSEILDVFRAAGRGLVAAHSAGIIHRDFKPENVLIDKQGRPRVTDFGLSRTRQAIEDDDEVGERNVSLSPSGDMAAPLTRSGAVLGTPSYMSPEQHRGRAADERSDQFAFCVSLHEALHGEHPFKGVDPTQLLDNVLAGKVVSEPASRTLTRRCRQAIARGLNPLPEDRFPSMEALLAQLTEPAGPKRRVSIMVAVGLVVLIGSGYALTRQDSLGSAPRCDRGAERMTQVWDAGRRTRLLEVLRQSGVAGAETTARSFASILDHRAASWILMHNQACAATHVEGAQSAETLDLRMECLERKRQEMKGLVDVFSERPDAAIVDRAVDAADRLSLVSACADVTSLRAVVPPPDDPAVRSRVASLRRDLSRAVALFEAGRFEQVNEQLRPLRAAADAIGYAPLRAEVLKALAMNRSFLGKGEEAEALLFEAAKQAAKGRDWLEEADIWISLVSNYGRMGRVQEGVLAGRAAEVAVDRASGAAALRARLMNNMGFASYNAGKLDDARKHLEVAADLYEASLGPSSPKLADAVSNLGSILTELGKMREGLVYLERSLAIRKATLRPGHPDVAYSWNGIGSAYLDLGMFQKAREAFRAAYETRKRELGARHGETSYSLAGIADAEAGLGNYRKAIDLYREALSIQESTLGPRHISVGATYLQLGDTQRRAGLHREAQVTLRKAIDHNTAAGSPEHPNTGFALVSLGLLHIETAAYAVGLGECRRAVTLLKKELGDNSDGVSLARQCVGEALLGTGDLGAARAELEQVSSSLDEKNSSPNQVAELRFLFARALWASRGERSRAMELARTALDLLARAEGDVGTLTDRIQDWLKTRPASL